MQGIGKHSGSHTSFLSTTRLPIEENDKKQPFSLSACLSSENWKYLFQGREHKSTIWRQAIMSVVSALTGASAQSKSPHFKVHSWQPVDNTTIPTAAQDIKDLVHYEHDDCVCPKLHSINSVDLLSLFWDNVFIINAAGFKTRVDCKITRT